MAAQRMFMYVRSGQTEGWTGEGVYGARYDGHDVQPWSVDMTTVAVVGERPIANLGDGIVYDAVQLREDV